MVGCAARSKGHGVERNGAAWCVQLDTISAASSCRGKQGGRAGQGTDSVRGACSCRQREGATRVGRAGRPAGSSS